jgi:hypothetical protein
MPPTIILWVGGGDRDRLKAAICQSVERTRHLSKSKQHRKVPVCLKFARRVDEIAFPRGLAAFTFQ